MPSSELSVMTDSGKIINNVKVSDYSHKNNPLKHARLNQIMLNVSIVVTVYNNLMCFIH